MKHFTHSFMLLALMTLCALGLQAQRRVPARSHVLPRPAADILQDIPEGEYLDNLNRTARGFYVTEDGYSWENNVTGVRGTLVVAPDGDVYFYNPVSQFETMSWLRLERAGGDTLVARLPQDIYEDYFSPSDAAVYFGIDHDTTLVYQLRRLTYGFDDEGEYYFPDPSGKMDIKFTFRGDTLRQVDETDVILGLADEVGNWVGYGDYGIIVKKLPSEPFLPGDAEWQDYMLDWVTNSEAANRTVKVAMKDKDVYLDNLYEGAPAGVVRGTLGDDGIVTFPSRQYLGFDEEHGRHIFFYGGRTYRTNDAWGESLDIFGFDEEIRLRLNAETRELTAVKDSTNFLVNVGDDMVYFYACYTRPHLVPYTDIAYTPAMPEINLDEYYVFDDEYGYGRIDFVLPARDVQGRFIDSNRLYYNIYMNGELYPIDPSVYVNFAETVVDIPFAYNDYYDFIALDGGVRQFYFYEDAVSIGVQSVYKGGGTTTRSRIAYINFEDVAVRTPLSEALKSGEIYDLQGRRVRTSDVRHGLYIQGGRKVLR
ncbi:MAG: hypothetical protein IJ659_02020 [Alloprevotella sp.]|nr:hypothetical protein [Alloprevotella sp.]